MTDERSDYWRILVKAKDVAPWLDEWIQDVRKKRRKGLYSDRLMYNQPEIAANDDERGVKFEKGREPAITVTIFDYNCKEPYRIASRISIEEAKEVAKWLLKRVKEEEPALPRRIWNTARIKTESAIFRARWQLRRRFGHG